MVRSRVCANVTVFHVLWPRKGSLYWACVVKALCNPCVITLLQSDYNTLVANTPQWKLNLVLLLIKSGPYCFNSFHECFQCASVSWNAPMCLGDVAECHDDLWGGEDADGVWRPENHGEAVWEWQRWRHRDNQEQNQEEREWVTSGREAGRQADRCFIYMEHLCLG